MPIDDAPPPAERAAPPVPVPPPPSAPAPVTVTRIDISLGTILKLLAVLGAVLLLVELWRILLQLFLGAVLASALYPLVVRLERWGLARGQAVVATLLGVVAVVAGVLWVFIPQLVEQGQEFWEELPTYVDDALGWLEEVAPGLYQRLEDWARLQSIGSDSSWPDVRDFLDIGMSIFGSIGTTVIVVTIAAYMLLEGARSLDWLLQFLPAPHRPKLRLLVPEFRRVVGGWVAGQLVNSTLFGAYSLTLLTLLDVPSAVVLAFIAFVLDAVPILGATLATIPAVVIALTVSPTTAIIVLAAYLLYQQIENAITSPRVFGRTLNISPLATVVAVLVGGALLGMVGVILALPVAAVIPGAVRIWRMDAAAVASAELDHGDW